MIYVQFFQKRGLDYAEVEDVAVLDKRTGLGAHLKVGAAECRKRGYAAFQVYRGPSLVRSLPAGPRIAI